MTARHEFTGQHHAERSDARANRLRVLEAARAVFAERGLAAEIKDIADRAGVGVGTVYRGFPGKESLLAAVVEEGVNKASSILEAAETRDDAAAGLRDFLAGLLGLVDEYGWVLKLYIGEQVAAEPEPFIESLGFDPRLGRIVDRAMSAGAFRPDLDPAIALLVIKGTVLCWNLKRDGQSLGEVVDGVMRLFAA